MAAELHRHACALCSTGWALHRQRRRPCSQGRSPSRGIHCSIICIPRLCLQDWSAKATDRKEGAIKVYKKAQEVLKAIHGIP